MIGQSRRPVGYNLLAGGAPKEAREKPTEPRGSVMPLYNEEGREVVVVEAVRTPVGRGHPDKGYYMESLLHDLPARSHSDVTARSGFPVVELENVSAGCVQE